MSVRRRRKHVLRITLVTVAALLVAIVGGVIIVLTNIDPDRLKPRIVAAVKLATGRDLVLSGPIHVSFSLQPSVQLTDVSFSNPPGFSRPMMATLQRLDLQLALLPLLRNHIEIERLVLVRPDLLLETDVRGQSNWVFSPKPRPTADGEAAPAHISFQDVRIDGGTIAWRDDEFGRSAVLRVTKLLMQAASADTPLHLAMQASANGAAFSLAGEVGPLSQFRHAEPGAPWPVKLQFDAGAATLTIDGNIGHLAKVRLYDLQLAGTAPDIAPLAAFLPGTRLPPLRDASVSARLVDTGSHVELDATLRVAGTSLAAKGTITDAAHFAGVDIALAADAADLLALSQMAGHPLPALRSIDFHARLTEAAGDLRRGIALRDMKFTSEQADVAGDIVAEYASRPSLRGKLTAARIDAGALGEAGNVGSLTQAGPETASSTIQDTPLPFGLLRAADAEIELAVGSLQSRGIVYGPLAARLALQDGRLQLAPFTAELPEGHVTGTLSADVTQEIPQIALTLHAAGLDVQPLLTVLRVPAEASGRLRVSLELHATGSTPRAIAAGLNGHLGLAMVNGKVSNWLLSNTVGWALREAALPGLAAKIGSSRLRCFALRFDVNDGVGELSTLLLDSSPLYLDGNGTVDLRDQTLDLSLRPEARVGDVGVFVPLRLTGLFAHPKVSRNRIATAQANAGLLVGFVEWLATPVRWLAEALGIIAPLARHRDDCTDPLIQARATETLLQPFPLLAPLQQAR